MNYMRLGDLDALKAEFTGNFGRELWHYTGIWATIDVAPTIDAVEVVRCYDCVHAVPLERNCELNHCLYMHCNLWRGEETRNVWHKYKRYYRDYSLVEHDDFCSCGERKEADGNG